MELRYFQLSEFDSPDQQGSGINMDKGFLQQLDKLRHRCGFPLHIISGYRTKDYNIIVKGALDSSHMRGVAADIRCRGNHERYVILREAIRLGFNRIGVYNNHIHVDIDDTLVGNVIWTGVSR